MAVGLPSVFLLLGVFVAAPLTDAAVFLGSKHPEDATHVLSAQTEHKLLVELEAALGSNHRHGTERRLKRIEQRLAPMFGAMSKNSDGRLGSSAAGYMLHRLFVQRHGWFIRALEPQGGAVASWNTSTPTSVLEERVPEHVQKLFEDHLGTHGLGVKELAILASTLEHLVHIEAMDRLTVSLSARNLTREDALSEDEALEVLDMYMAIYILGFLHSNLNTMTAATALELHDNILELYPSWPETQQFLREVYKSVAPKRDYVYFSEMENVVGELGERYGRFQDVECRSLKDMLVASEDSSVGGAGRVRIADFYKKALVEGKWQFSESIDYLRQLGALDESDKSNPRVIIPNYISGPSNCVASSAYYSVCCLDECEAILGRIEETVGAPEASPSQVVALVSTIPSSTVKGDRTLSSWLLERLEQVGAHHGGLVPLHGRLFAQWLHYAYPRECQFPHVSGSINPVRPEDLMEFHNVTEDDISASEEVMQQVISRAAPTKQRAVDNEASAADESGMWSMDEELVVWREKPVELERTSSFLQVGYVRGIGLFGAAVSLSFAVVQSMQKSSGKEQEASQNKFFV
jgi:hypothetical protein